MSKKGRRVIIFMSTWLFTSNSVRVADIACSINKSFIGKCLFKVLLPSFYLSSSLHSLSNFSYDLNREPAIDAYLFALYYLSDWIDFYFISCAFSFAVHFFYFCCCCCCCDIFTSSACMHTYFIPFYVYYINFSSRTSMSVCIHT